MKKNFLNLGLQPMANDFKKKFDNLNRYRLLVSFDNKTKLVSITKHLKSQKMFTKSYPYRSRKSLIVKKLFRELSLNIKKNLSIKKF